MAQKKIFAAFVVLFAMFFLIQGGKVFAGNDFLTTPSIQVYVGDTVDLTKYVPEEDKSLVTYKLGDESIYSSAISLQPIGQVKAERVGTATVEIELKKGLLVQKDEIEIVVSDPQDLSVKYGSTFTIDVQESPLYANAKLVSNNTSVQITTSGAITVNGFDNASIYVEKSDGPMIKVANLTILQPQFANYVTCRAKGTDSYKPKIRNCKKNPEISVATSDSSILKKTGKSKLKAMKKGVSTVSATVTSKCGQKRDITMDVQVTNPSLKKKKIVIAKGVKKNVSVKGVDNSSEINWKKSDSSKISVKSDGTIVSKKVGETQAKVVVDGKKLSCKVVVTDPTFKEEEGTAYLEKKQKLSIDGLDQKDSKVTYESNDEKVLSVTDEGEIQAKKIGSAEVKVVADGRKMSIPVNTRSEVAEKAAAKEIAISKTRTRYSQGRRMSGSNYDCSSLVWRCYSQFGEVLGSKSKRWAPTAAEIGRWCVKNNKVLAKGSISTDKLLPGDLVFYAYDGHNGRYKNISHIEMYVGNGDNVSASHSHNRVIKYPYTSHTGHIVLVARPRN